MPKTAPDYLREAAIGGVVAGIDEAGRGPWAGPVVAAAAILDPDRAPAGLNDSKRLGAGRREALFDALTASPHAVIGVGRADVDEIDRLNILQATMLAMGRAAAALATRPAAILVDGNRAPPIPFPCHVETMVRGDARSLSIAAASIVAKVIRDRIMTELSAQYPGYGWERNAGYGTAEHRAALERLGVTAQHRRSFAPIRQLLTQGHHVTD